MPKRFLAALAAFLAFSSLAADVNTASRADLEAVTGLGPGLAGRIIDARRDGTFKDWRDFVARVPGVGARSAARLSAHGLTVNGVGYAGASASAASK